MTAQHRVWFLFFDDHQVLDIAGPVAALSAVNDLFPEAPPYDIKLVAGRAGIVPSNSPLRIMSDVAWHDLIEDTVDTLIVTGGDNMHVVGSDREVANFIIEAGRKAERVCSICTGAFLLGSAGLLEGKRVATHWSSADDLLDLHPTITVDRDAIYVVDGNVWTSAGVTSGLDMTLALIEADHGHDIAVSVARRLVVYMIRPGGQAQFSVHLNNVRKRTDIVSQIMAEIETNLAKTMTIKGLAARSGMSVRNFTRRFTDEVGQSPTVYITLRRLSRAQTLLEKSDLPLKSISNEVGFSSVSALRRSFSNQFGINPNEYRNRFSVVERDRAIKRIHTSSTTS